MILWTDNPPLDAERYYSTQTDPRPIFDRCIHCGRLIRCAAPGWEGDEYVETPDGPVHWDCWDEYGRKMIREAR